MTEDMKSIHVHKFYIGEFIFTRSFSLIEFCNWQSNQNTLIISA
jgi:hypothetical protein